MEVREKARNDKLEGQSLYKGQNGWSYCHIYEGFTAVKPPIKLRGQTANKKTSRMYSMYTQSTAPLKEDNLSTKDKTAGPKGVLYYELPL